MLYWIQSNQPNIPAGSVFRIIAMNIIKFRYLYFAISLLVIVPGIIALILWGLPLGIDFTGGSLLEVQFASGNPPSIAEVSALYNE